MSKRWSRNILILLIVTLLIVVLSIGCVFADWHYEFGMAEALKIDVPTSIFLWQEIPTGEEGGIIETTNTAIETSLNNANSEINTSIDAKSFFGLTTVSSVDNLHGDQMRQELGLDASANFLVDFSDPNTRILYTTTVQLAGQSSFGAVEYLIPQGEWIYPVYRTIARFDSTTGKWKQESTQRGYAASDEYVTFLSAAPLFDPNSWTRGKIGTGIGDAIYAYKGQNVTATLDSQTDTAYYKVVLPKRNSSVDISIVEPNNATITVVNAQNVPISKVKNNGTSHVSFKSGAKNETYYFRVTGGENIKFNIV